MTTATATPTLEPDAPTAYLRDLLLATTSRAVRVYADRIVAGLEHYAGHEDGLLVCGRCDVLLPVRTADEILAAQRVLLMLVWDERNGSNPLGLTRGQSDALMTLNSRLADHRARASAAP